MTLEHKFRCEFEDWIIWVLWASDQVETRIIPGNSGMVLGGAAGHIMYHLHLTILHKCLIMYTIYYYGSSYV